MTGSLYVSGVIASMAEGSSIFSMKGDYGISIELNPSCLYESDPPSGDKDDSSDAWLISS